MATNQTLKKGETDLATTVQTRQTKLLEKIKSKLGGKELSDELSNLIIEASNGVLSMKEKIALLYTFALEKEKLSKEEGKTIVAETLNVSVRTAERYLPIEYKDQKYVSNAAKQIQEEKRLGNGSRTVQTQRDKKEETETDTDDDDDGIESPKETVNRLKSMWKNSHEITVQGKTFKVFTKSYPDKKVTELSYDEKDIIRALKGTVRQP
jgi:hypothetical protein